MVSTLENVLSISAVLTKSPKLTFGFCFFLLSYKLLNTFFLLTSFSFDMYSLIAVTAIEISNPVAPIFAPPAVAPTLVPVKVLPELTPKIHEFIPAIVEVLFLMFNNLTF